MDKPFPYTKHLRNQGFMGSETMLRIGKVLGTCSALSVSSGLMCLFYFGKVACLYWCSLLF